MGKVKVKAPVVSSRIPGFYVQLCTPKNTVVESNKFLVRTGAIDFALEMLNKGKAKKADIIRYDNNQIMFRYSKEKGELAVERMRWNAPPLVEK